MTFTGIHSLPGGEIEREESPIMFIPMMTMRILMVMITITTMITIKTMTLPMATITTMMRLPMANMTGISIPMTMGMSTKRLKTVPLPICTNTAITFFMHTITPTTPSIPAWYIRCSVIP